MKIERQEHGKKGAFFIEQNGEWVAEMTYIKSGEKEITIDHTEVDESLQGEGIAKDLIAEAVKYARENNLKIAATCSYAEKELAKNADYADVLAAR